MRNATAQTSQPPDRDLTAGPTDAPCAEESGRAGALPELTADQLRLLFDRVSDGVLVVRLDPPPGKGLRLVYCNAAFAERAGHPRDQLVGSDPTILLDVASEGDRIATLGRAIRDGRPCQVGLTVRARKGPPYTADIDGSPLGTDADGGRLYAIVSRDATAQAREARLRAAVETINDAFVLLDDEHRLVLYNQRFLDFYPELQPVMVPGATMWEMTEAAVRAGAFPDAIGREEEWMAARLSRYQAPGAPFEQLLSSGKWVRIAESRTADGWTVSLRTDITAEKEAERRLKESELRFRTLTEAAPAGVFLTDPEGRFVYANPALCRLAGKPPGSLEGWSWRDAVHPDDLPVLTRATRQAARNRDGFQYTIRLGNRWCNVLGAPHRDIHGTMVGFIGTVIDVHAQRMAEAALRDSEQRYRQIVDTAHEGIMLTNADGTVTFANNRMAELLGRPVADVIGRQELDFLDGHLRAMVSGKLANRRRGVAEQYDLQFTRPDGTEVWTLVSATPLVNGNGTYAGTLAMVVDITERHRADLALARHVREIEESRRLLQENAVRLVELAERYEREKERAEESSQAKSRFLSSMSHELRTPLNSILGFSDILRSPDTGPEDEKLRSFAEDIHQAGQYLLELINDILDMSKIEAGKYELRLAPAATYRLIEDTVRMVRQNAADSRLELTQDLAPDLPERIRVDARAIRQVLLNLLSNAIKFTPRGGRVTVRARTCPGTLELSVTDTGIGIAPEHLTTLGRPFVQIDSALNRRHQGSGLGLALSKSLVEMHGGRLIIESEPDKGTCVNVTLPLQ